ncbi:Alpha/Beta hydrolase protein [Amylocystis lapponica]|nr:Alpha/Beta hydrolase protein [Amylocystis lapponica]
MPLASLIDQQIHTVPSFSLESGRVLRDVPVAYKTWGKLNSTKDNAMVICHAFTGSADVQDWINIQVGPLMGRGKAFDPNRFFIFCANILGSPYGSASPITVNPDTGRPYGPEFPATTIRDDVRLHKLVLDHLGVSSVAVAIGGSLGGMTILEWPLCTPPGYVRHIIPIATSARHSAWCISWGEAQRQSIYSDPTYEMDFTRHSQHPAWQQQGWLPTDIPFTRLVRKSFRTQGAEGRPSPGLDAATLAHGVARGRRAAAHNDGHRNARHRTTPSGSAARPPCPPSDLPSSYLRYQGDKFTSRFDANCYIHITRKMDTHDVSRGRTLSPDEDESVALARVLSALPSRALVIGIQTDGLFFPSEQREIATYVPDGEVVIIPSPEGHDGFLLEFELINGHILRFLKREFPEYYPEGAEAAEEPEEGFDVKKTSMFGEAEADITRW